MKVGFAGLGAMGSAMAKNILQAGHTVMVWNRSPQAADDLVALGATRAADPTELAYVDVLISMLADDHATWSVIVESGLLNQMAPHAVHVNMATISVALAQQLDALHQARHVGYIAAPVLGRTEVAAAGQLNILAAGDAATLAKVQPLLDIMGQKTWYFGDTPAQANVVKIAANFTLASAIETMAEGAALVRNHGVGAQDFLSMLSGTLFNCPAYKNYGGMIAEERFSPAGFKLTLGLKDVSLALEASQQSRTPLPFAGVLRDNFIDAIAQGDGDLDWAGVATVSARRAGLK
ncbi:NAD(P)-dependent oxidoreductase [Nissabacter sp. SGAir0207]|uniref:NAD(P)-dependent oxidoreductase n=1 Tax=Nissabacter sp. SGAir0207 TaxID=2126321 RepID=UPI0010CCFE64|nr:NAD(P)-dependent oxidoreductase [Nissabacter sp. SGAir0207]QCR36346.1 oxidoreductase [Nissabacter sp. SGAir0207]